VFALVFPSEVAALPNIGKALAALCVVETLLLKGEGIPGLIGGGGVRLVEHFAEVNEVRLRGGSAL
jgi:hypothetical protein